MMQRWPKGQKGSKGQEDEKRNGSAASSSKQEQSLQSLVLGRTAEEEAKLLAMLEEALLQPDEGSGDLLRVGGRVGSATVYSVFASKAMSRHFRCLRDGIVGQLQVTRKAMEEPGMSPSSTFSPQSQIYFDLLGAFLFAYSHGFLIYIVYVSDDRTISSVSNWFINARVRLWNPMVEEMYMEETKEHDHLRDGVVSPSDIDENGHPG
ncbi:hypothetical protein MLD38_005299 [Melastoma candidum]|uniref:Uncharacterized protein n=1 Tax=Melastoma candidum TaxID=119954 RepID=A0ACB9SBP8_9MYRT|nr:hypothetical protein MLD38_005299 [Melastoma candidum]